MSKDLFNIFLSEKKLYFYIILALIIWFLCKNTDIAFTAFISVVFAFSLLPLVDKLSKKMNRLKATLLVLTGVAIVTFAAIVPIVVLCFYQVKHFMADLPSYINHLNNILCSTPILKNIGIMELNPDTIFNSLSTTSDKDILKNISSAAQDIGTTFLYTFTGLIVMFFLILDDKLIKKTFLSLFPPELREKTSLLVDNIANRLSGYIAAQVIVCASVWVTMTLGLLLFHIKYALVLGAIAGVMAMIPVAGSAISLLICVVATFDCGIKTVITVILLFTVSHFIENHVVRPYVYSKFLNIHQIIVFLSLIVGAKYAGVMGVLFAPPAAVTACILLDELYLKKMD